MKENENQEPSNMAGAAKGGTTSKKNVGSAVSAAVGEPVATDDLPLLPARPKSMMGQTLGYSDDDMREYALTAIAARLAAPTQVSAPQAEPQGWKLVPFKYTAEMRAAWDRAPQSEDDDVEFGGAWVAMLNAAPVPQAAGAPQAGQEAQASAAREVRAVPDLHNAIMNIPCKRDDASFLNKASRLLYKEGHRDARHAAAELAIGYVPATAGTSGAPAAPDEVRDTALGDAIEAVALVGCLWLDSSNRDAAAPLLNQAISDIQALRTTTATGADHE